MAVLRAAYNPTVTRNFAQHFINTQDLAACFLLYESVMRSRPEEVAGEAFLVTGETNLWTWDELRYVLQLFAGRNLRFIVLPALPLFVLAHIIGKLFSEGLQYVLMLSFHSYRAVRLLEVLHVPAILHGDIWYSTTASSAMDGEDRPSCIDACFGERLRWITRTIS